MINQTIQQCVHFTKCKTHKASLVELARTKTIAKKYRDAVQFAIQTLDEQMQFATTKEGHRNAQEANRHHNR